MFPDYDWNDIYNILLIRCKFNCCSHQFLFPDYLFLMTMVHPTLHSYDVILNVTISNFGCLDVNASLSSDNTGPWPPCISCGEIRSSICFKTVSKSSTLFSNVFLNAYRSSTMSYFIMLWKEPNWCLRFIQSRVLPGLGFSSSEFTSSDSITGKSMSVAIYDLTSNERMHGLTCWMKHVGRYVQTIKTFIHHSSNIYPAFHSTCCVKCWISLTRPLDRIDLVNLLL